MPATMKISSNTTSIAPTVSVYTRSGVVMPITTASSVSRPPGCSG